MITTLILARAFARNPAHQPAHVFLDGVDISADCYAADARRGLALCFKTGDAGAIQEDPARPGRVLREARHGQVFIVVDVPLHVLGKFNVRPGPAFHLHNGHGHAH